MRYFIYISCLLAVIQVSCKREHIGCFETTTPACISQKIQEIQSNPKGWGAYSVSEYTYNGVQVYLFYMNCCDRYNPLYDSNCKYICSPSGGIGGGGDRLCTDFYSTAVFIREVWKDPR